MSGFSKSSGGSVTSKRIFYGWIIVAASTTLLAVHAGVIFSFGVFFKPLTADFGWNRATTSTVYSLFFIFLGSSSVTGWLADKYGVARVTAILLFLAGLGLLLTSRVHALWQLYLTYSVLTAIGFSGNIAITSATTARWFLKRRGQALGIVSAGVGLGTLVLVPVVERLIARFGWSTSYVIVAVTVWAIMVPCALSLKRDPKQMGLQPYGLHKLPVKEHVVTEEKPSRTQGISLSQAIHTKPLWMFIFINFFVIFCVQMTMVHLVNYATDMGITPAMAATFVSMIGVGSVGGRLLMGIASDRIGGRTATMICCATMAVSLVIIVFAKEPWMFYLFALIFGFGYGGEIPQIPLLVGQFYSLKSATSLVGAVLTGNALGGALGSWVAGFIFDATQSYRMAFLLGLVASIAATGITLMLRKTEPVSITAKPAGKLPS